MQQLQINSTVNVNAGHYLDIYMILFQSTSDRYTCDNSTLIKAIEQQVYLLNEDDDKINEMLFPESIICKNHVFLTVSFLPTKIWNKPYLLYITTPNVINTPSNTSDEYKTTSLLYINVEPENISPFNSQLINLNYSAMKKYSNAIGDSFVYSNEVIAVLASLRDDYNNSANKLCKPNTFSLIANTSIKFISMGQDIETNNCLIYFMISNDLKEGTINITAIVNGQNFIEILQTIKIDSVNASPEAQYLVYKFKNRQHSSIVGNISVGIIINLISVICIISVSALIVKKQPRQQK